MKRRLFCLLMLMAVLFISAEDIAIRRAWKLDFNGRVVECADGSLIALYHDTDAGDTDIYAQKFTPAGQELWAQPKIIAQGLREQNIYQCVKTVDNNFVIIYRNNHPDDQSLSSYSLQKFSTNGQLLWGEDAVPVPIPASADLAPFHIIPNADGGVFLVYRIFDTDDDRTYEANVVYCYNIDTYGNILNPGPGQLLVSDVGTIRFSYAISDGCGGLILNVERYVTEPTFYTRNELYRFDGSLIPIGPAPLLSEADFPPLKYDILMDKLGRILLWKTVGNQLHLQRMDLGGNLEFDSAISFAFGFNTVGSDEIGLPQLVPTDDGGLGICFFHYAENRSEVEARAFRLSDDLQHLWDDGGVLMGSYIYGMGESWAHFSMSPTGKAWLIWTTWLPDIEKNIVKLQSAAENGDLAFEAGGKTLCTGSYWFEYFHLKPNAAGTLLFYKDYNDNNLALKRNFITNAGAESWEGGAAFVSHLGGVANEVKIEALDSGYFVYWVDNRSGMPQIYYQIYDADLSPLLETGGRAIANLGLHSGISEPVLLPDGSLAFALMLRRSYFDRGSLYLQRISNTGELIYDEPGLPLVLNNFQGSYLSMMPPALLYNDGEDIYVAWRQADIRAQKISDGELIWEEAGRVLVPSSPEICDLELNFFSGGYLLYSYMGTGGVQYNRVKRILADGEADPAWPEEGEGLFVFPEPSDANRYYYRHAQVFDGELIVFGRSFYAGACLAQKVYPDGDKKWNEPGLYLPFPRLSMIKDLSDGFIFLHQLNTYTLDQYLQKMDTEGELCFTADEHIFSIGLLEYPQDLAIMHYANGATYCMMAKGFGPAPIFEDLFYRKVGPAGELMGELEIFCDEPFRQHHIGTATLGNSGLVVWNDARHGIVTQNTQLMSVYGRRLDAFPTSNEDEYVTAPVMTRLLQNYPNPFNPETTISFDLATAGELDLGIYNIKGQLVKTLVRDQKLSAGRHSFVWDGKDENGKNVSSGIYLYRLQNGRYSHSKKMIMLK